MADEHILVVEDDESLALWIYDYLCEHGFEVSLANRGDLVRDLVEADMPALVVLDIRLPHKDGFEVCRELREFYKSPILMMTASGEEQDELLSFELGADDYIQKPVRPRLLLARIKALLRRSGDSDEGCVKHLEFGKLQLDADAKRVSLAGAGIKLTGNEFDVLWALACRAGKVVSRTDLVAELRGIEYDGFDRSIDVRISRLRKKLGDPGGEAQQIKTIWGQGYVFVGEPW
ncbi:response regulator transcription factor [Agaribacterium haliotis]|uniref:response regulator transcription factor n=1 Tax=Agaribacterium haliotis TaxID=2013869 RepID=UPI001EFC8B83|nr:response regulator transcription factor [Agaribacterium haliotis]